MENDGQSDQTSKPENAKAVSTGVVNDAPPQHPPTPQEATIAQPVVANSSQPIALESVPTNDQQQPVQPALSSPVVQTNQRPLTSSDLLPWEKKAKTKKIVTVAALCLAVVGSAVTAYLFYSSYQKDRITNLEVVKDEVFSFKIPEGWVYEDGPEGEFPGKLYHSKKASYQEDGEDKYNILLLHAADTKSLQGIKLSEIPIDQRSVVEGSIKDQFTGNSSVGVQAAKSFTNDFCDNDVDIEESKEITTIGALGFRTSFECKTKENDKITVAKGAIIVAVPERHSRMDIIFFVAHESVYDKNETIIEDILSSGAYND